MNGNTIFQCIERLFRIGQQHVICAWTVTLMTRIIRFALLRQEVHWSASGQSEAEKGRGAGDRRRGGRGPIEAGRLHGETRGRALPGGARGSTMPNGARPRTRSSRINWQRRRFSSRLGGIPSCVNASSCQVSGSFGGCVASHCSKITRPSPYLANYMDRALLEETRAQLVCQSRHKIEVLTCDMIRKNAE